MSKILNVTQGSPDWLAARTGKLCASDAPCVMNASKYKSRAELLREMAGAGSQDVSAAKQKLFDRGHESEAAIRSHIETLIGDELYPVTVMDDEGRMLASLDGQTMIGDIIFEHKLYSVELAHQVMECELEPHYYFQLEHQLHVSGAKKAIFVTSDGTPEKCLHMEYYSDPDRLSALLAGWKQFEEDLANYQHVEVLPAAVADPVMSLPSVSVQVNGSLSVISNLSLFGEKLKEFVSNIDKSPSDDQAFANCEAAIKVLKKAEDALDAAESSALAQIACVDEMRTMKETLHELARNNRLTLEKIVKTRKETVRVEIQQSAEKAFREHVSVINTRLGTVQLPVIKAGFAEVMKAKKTFSSLRDAVDAELARVKIEANALGEKIDANLRTLKELAADHKFLFMDVQQIVLKENSDLVNLVKLRIAEHEAAEKAKREAQLEKEREQIRKQEEAKARAEAEAKLRAEQAEQLRQVKPVTDPVVTEVRVSPPDPVVTSVQPAPVRTVATKAKVQHVDTRPSDAEIITVLTLHYRVHESKVIEWLLDMDLVAESEKLRSAM